MEAQMECEVVGVNSLVDWFWSWRCSAGAPSVCDVRLRRSLVRRAAVCSTYLQLRSVVFPQAAPTSTTYTHQWRSQRGLCQSQDV